MKAIAKHFSFRAICAGAAALVASSAFAAQIVVARNDPKADDKNPGTEARPLKTIQAAVDKAQPGDTIWVKAGNYEEPVMIDKSATMARPIVLSAWKDDRVRIGYVPRPLPTEGKWEPIPGSKSWQIKLAADVPEDFLVLLDEQGDPHLLSGRAAQGRESQLGDVSQVGPHADVQRQRQESRRAGAVRVRPASRS